MTEPDVKQELVNENEGPWPLSPQKHRDQLSQELTMLLQAIDPGLLARYQGCKIGFE